MGEYTNLYNKSKLSRNWYLSAVTLAIVSNFISYIIIFDYEAEFMLFSTTSTLLVLTYYLKNFISFQDDDVELTSTSFPEFILGKNGIIQNANKTFIQKFVNIESFEIGRNFASQIPPNIFNRIISPVFFGKPILVIINSKTNNGSIKNYIAIPKGPLLDKDSFRVFLFPIDSNDNSFDSESHQQRLQAIGQLAIGISHDFNNVLTAIRGYSDLLQEKVSENSEIYEDVLQIKENCKRASSLVKQLLTFSKKHEVKYVKLELHDVVSQTYKLLGRLLGEKIEINISKKTDSSLILADKNQIEQVIMNLALNAKDAMIAGGQLNIIISRNGVDSNSKTHLNSLYRPSGSGEIEDGRYIELKIEDTGFGIQKDLLSKVFEPFFTTKGNLKGTGLGLSTVCEIVKQTGGHLFVQSNDTGTIFIILFKEYREAEEQPMRRNQRAIALDEADKQKTAVLVVEDEEPVRVFSAHALRNRGYLVYEAENAEQALEIFEKHKDKIKILITDIIMPGINGPDLASKILAMKKDINVILMSGYTEEEISPLSNQDFLFLSKPFSLDRLVETVGNSLKLKEDA